MINENDDLPLSIAPDGAADLKAVLAAWNSATVRLQETHECLRSEVRRLTDELEIKNRELAQRIDWPTWGRWHRTSPTRSAITWCRSRCI